MISTDGSIAAAPICQSSMIGQFVIPICAVFSSGSTAVVAKVSFDWSNGETAISTQTQWEIINSYVSPELLLQVTVF